MSQPVSTTSRDTYFDSLKFILIAFVVMGHVFDQNMNDSISLAINNTFYLFRIPLFIFISGYFCKKSASAEKKKKTILKLAETLLTFQLISYLLWGIINKGAFAPLWTIFIYPAWTLWYLYSLIWWRLLIYAMPQKFIDNYKFVICSAFLISLLGGFIPVHTELSLQRTMTYMPLFFLGYYCGHGQIPFSKHWMNKVLAVVVLVSAFIIMLIINKDIHTILYGSYPYTFSQNMLGRMGYRALQLISVMVMGVAVLSLVKPLPNKFNRMSRETLFIYVYHSFVIIIISHYFKEIVPENIMIEYSFLMNLVMYATICFTIWVMMKFRFTHYLMNPISNLFSKQK